MTGISLFVINALVFYFIVWIYNSFTFEDNLKSIYTKHLMMSIEETSEIIELAEKNNLAKRFMGEEVKDFDTMSNLLEDSIKNKEKHQRIKTDKKYRLKEVLKYKMKVTRGLVIRTLKILLELFFDDLWTLLPVLILMLTGSLNMAMATSLIVMVIFSIKREEIHLCSLEYFYGEEVVENSSVRVSVFLTVVAEAITKQGYYFTFILLINIL